MTMQLQQAKALVALLETQEANDDRMFRVWRFEDAPQELQDLSRNGGDEDWIAVVPRSIVDSGMWLPWVEAMGCCCVDTYPLPDGSEVRIGCHA